MLSKLPAVGMAYASQSGQTMLYPFQKHLLCWDMFIALKILGISSDHYYMAYLILQCVQFPSFQSEQ